MGFVYLRFFGQNPTKSSPNQDPILAKAQPQFRWNLYLMLVEKLSEKFVSGRLKRFIILMECVYKEAFGGRRVGKSQYW